MAGAPLELAGGYKKTVAGTVDFYYDNDGNGWANVAAACAGVPVGIRLRRTVLIEGAGEYWWMSGTTDNDLIPKAGGFVPISQNQYGTHPAFSSQAALNAYLLGGNYTPPVTPAAPTNGIVDDVNNTFDFTLSQY